MTNFSDERAQQIAKFSEDAALKGSAHSFMKETIRTRYSYNFDWLGRPIIQYPQDIVAWQELIWTIKPDLIIETGIAHGGSLILSASVLAMLDYADAVESGGVVDPKAPKRKVLGVDIDIRAHNRSAIEAHPLAGRIDMIEGSSIAPEIVAQVASAAQDAKTVLLSLDSNHTHDHVLAELEFYAPMVTKGSYACVFDTVVEDLPNTMFDDRPWGPGDNPKTAVWKYLESHDEFEIDKALQDKLQITVAPDGFLKRIS